VSLPADVFVRGLGSGSGVKKLLLCAESRGVVFWWAMSIDLMGKAEREMEPAANEALARRPREVERRRSGEGFGEEGDMVSWEGWVVDELLGCEDREGMVEFGEGKNRMKKQ
jgi:hypothetical protein